MEATLEGSKVWKKEMKETMAECSYKIKEEKMKLEKKVREA